MICASDSGSGRIEADVAIVGAGPVGLSLALALGRSGVRVAVIDSGGEGAQDWTRDLARAEHIDPAAHAPVESSTHRRLGGASWIWGGRCVDFDPIDFDPPPAGGPPGWPIGYAEAMSEAPAAAAFLGIGRPDFDQDFDWLPADRRVYARLERWCADPRLVRRHGAEIRGSALVRFWTGLTCVSVGVDADGGVTGLELRSRSGAPRSVAASRYVVAAGGIETARLLMASPDVRRLAPGPESWLGRGYMGHLEGAIADIVLDGLEERKVDYRRGPDCYVRPRLTLSAELLKGEGLLNIGFVIDNPRLADGRHGSGPLSAAALALGAPLLGEALQPGPVRQILLGRAASIADAPRHLRNVLADVPGTAAFLGRVAATRYARPAAPGLLVSNRARRYRLGYFGEQLPRAESRIVLSDTRDPLGLPRVRIEKRLCEEDVRSVLDGHRVFDRELRRNGLGRLEYAKAPAAIREEVAAQAGDGYHQMGTVRMSARPRDGVVDENCRVHGTRNLYAVGAAVCPTSGQANPTYTAVCLGLRLAKRLATELRG